MPDPKPTLGYATPKPKREWPWWTPGWKKQNAAHAEALTYLAGVINVAAGRAPDPSVIRSRVGVVLEILQYPERGKISDWEEKVAAMLYGTDDEPSEPWETLLAEFFKFARKNLYCGFVKQHNVSSYERVRACLAAVAIEAKPVEELSLGRL